MNTISSTSVTSTSGVTLMSLITPAFVIVVARCDFSGHRIHLALSCHRLCGSCCARRAGSTAPSGPASRPGHWSFAPCRCNRLKATTAGIATHSPTAVATNASNTPAMTAFGSAAAACRAVDRHIVGGFHDAQHRPQQPDKRGIAADRAQNRQPGFQPRAGARLGAQHRLAAGLRYPRPTAASPAATTTHSMASEPATSCQALFRSPARRHCSNLAARSAMSTRCSHEIPEPVDDDAHADEAQEDQHLEHPFGPDQRQLQKQLSQHALMTRRAHDRPAAAAKRLASMQTSAKTRRRAADCARAPSGRCLRATAPRRVRRPPGQARITSCKTSL